MPLGRDTEEFEKFVQNLIHPVAPEAHGPSTAATNITIITGSVRCKIYVGCGAKVATSAEPSHQKKSS